MRFKIGGSESNGSQSPRRTEGDPTEILGRREFLRVLGSRGSLAVGAFAIGLGIDWSWARLVRGPRLDRQEYPRFVLGGFRVHHSVIGYLAVVLGLAWHPVVLIPLGLGVIVGHGRRDRYGFIERVGPR